MRYYIKTYGCQMNIGDSAKLADVLQSAGYQEIDNPEKADLILVNTCVVRQGAEDRAAWYITSLKGQKKLNPKLIIGVCGCLVTEPGRDVQKQFPHVDLFIPPSMPNILSEYLNNNLTFDIGHLKLSKQGSGDRGLVHYVTIMTGCDNFCSYCIVPYVRGREFSRPMGEILTEIRQLKGIKEIYLLGQNVNSYKYGLETLLRSIESDATLWQNGLQRIRFMTSHPRDMSDIIINTVAELPHVCEFFHLPIQHGDDEILKKMNRGYTIDYYLKLVDKIRAKIPGAAITSDLIVGYPGETEEQFQNSLKIIEQVGFDACNTLAYSTRPGTAAAKLIDDIPEEVKQTRLQQAMALVNDVAIKINQKLVGATEEILIDDFRCDKKKNTNVYKGRTRTNKIVKVLSESENLLGQLVPVKITQAQSWKLLGEVVG